MRINRNNISTTKVKIAVTAELSELAKTKNKVLNKNKEKIKIPGFRQGKAPLAVVEKHIDDSTLQAEVIDELINILYQQAVKNENIKPINNPKISLSKFVPFTSLEFEAEIDIIGEIKLADYKNIKRKIPKTKVSSKEVEEVINNLRRNKATKTMVKRAVIDGDEVTINFSGVDSKGQPIKNAEAKNHILRIGSKEFIPGFEDAVIGMKQGEIKKFELKFPKDYGSTELANKKVTFTVELINVNKVTMPKIDKEFLAKLGPFKSIDELKTTITEQLTTEKQIQEQRKFENELIKDIVLKSSVDLPDALVDEQIEHLKNEVKQNAIYRGQTWQEMLEKEGKTEQQFLEEILRPEAEKRATTGLILSEISIREGLKVSDKEVDDKIAELKMQYNDKQMHIELDKPSAKNEIASRILSEKTVQRISELAQKAK